MSIITAIPRLCIHFSPARTLHTTSQLLFRSTPALYAEPLKKKKKIDPQVVKQREERKKKKIEKQIRRLEKNARQLKPIEELQVPLDLLDEKEKRTRPVILSSETFNEDKSMSLDKSWAKYKMKEKIEDLQQIDRLLMAQEKALNELKLVSEELYQAAIEPDLNLLVFTSHGPVSTPPIENYEQPDGEYIDVSKKWES